MLISSGAWIPFWASHMAILDYLLLALAVVCSRIDSSDFCQCAINGNGLMEIKHKQCMSVPSAKTVSATAIVLYRTVHT